MPMDAKPERLLTFASGGWVIVLVVVVCAALLVWALAPAVLRISHRPPGDGKSIESFAFDLSNLNVPRDLVVPGMLHRDMVPVLTDPTHSGPDAAAVPHERWLTMQRRNDPKYGKYMVSSDLVIGVIVNGESRAYPLHVMYVHEIINDTLGGTPIAVTYNWPCHSAMVFDRRIQGGAQGVAVFAASGLMYNSNLLMYSRNETRPGAGATQHGGGGESLWSQLLAKPVSGREVELGTDLTPLPYDLVTWTDWSERHPDTTVVDRDLSMAQRYKDAAPTQYFRSDKILFPVRPLADAPPSGPLDLKTPVLAVITSEGRHVYPIPFVLHKAQPRTAGSDIVEWSDTIGDGNGARVLRFIGDRKAKTLRVESEPPDPSMLAINCFWFAWHAMHPDDVIASAE
jgi:hypothetical protein